MTNQKRDQEKLQQVPKKVNFSLDSLKVKSHSSDVTKNV